MAQIFAVISLKVAQVHYSIHTLEKEGELVTTFSVPAWHALTDYAEVMADRSIIFHWRNGNSTSVTMEEIEHRL